MEPALIHELVTQLPKAPTINDTEFNSTRAPVTMETESCDVQHRITLFYVQTSDRSGWNFTIAVQLKASRVT